MQASGAIPIELSVAEYGTEIVLKFSYLALQQIGLGPLEGAILSKESSSDYDANCFRINNQLWR
jgi:hypothetical protein